MISSSKAACSCPLIGVDERMTRDIDATMKVHANSSLLDRDDDVIDMFVESEMMEDRWKRFHTTNPFVGSAIWTDVLASLREMTKNIRAIGSGQ